MDNVAQSGTFMHDELEFAVISCPASNARFAVEASALEAEIPLFNPYTGESLLLDDSDLECRVLSGRIFGDDDDTVLAVYAQPGSHGQVFRDYLLSDAGFSLDDPDHLPEVFVITDMALGAFLGRDAISPTDEASVND